MLTTPDESPAARHRPPTADESLAAARWLAGMLGLTTGEIVRDLDDAARSGRLTLAPDPHIDPATILPGCRWRSVADFARESIGPATARLAGRYGLHPGMGAVAEEVAGDAVLAFPNYDPETVAAVARRAVAGAAHIRECGGK